MGDLDGRIGGCGVHLPAPHRHIKNTSTHGAVLTENKLETGRKTLEQLRL